MSAKRASASEEGAALTDADRIGGRPRPEQLNPAQLEFWNYLETFNRLPENPTPIAVAVFHAKGIAPEFRSLAVSKTSVLGNLAGLTAQRELFVTRYPWVAPLLEHYAIQVPVSGERFSGTAAEIGEKYAALIKTSVRCAHNPGNEKALVRNFLEGLLVVDYVYASGTAQDKQAAMAIVDGVFQINGIIHPFRKALETSLLTPASRDIGWAAIANFPELICGQTTNLVRGGFADLSLAERVNFSKWRLRTPGLREMENLNERKFEAGMIHNDQVRGGLLSYSIYTAHCQEVIRPRDSPGLVVIEKLFQRLFPRDFPDQYQRYLTLLNAAYPKNKT
jgi:hypothetical protein